MAKVTLKTAATDTDVRTYLDSLTPERRAVAETLLAQFTSATGTKAKIWGKDIIGFGEYDYSRSNGDTGTFLATGFALRAFGPTLYILPGYNDYSDILATLGPHKLGKSCVYLKNLDDIHLPTLRRLLKAGLRDLKRSHTVRL